MNQAASICETSQRFVNSSTANSALDPLVLLLPWPGGAEALLGVEIQVDDGVQEAEQ